MSNSIIADGCVVEGTVENCVLFRGVKVEKGAHLENCVVMQDAVIGANCRMNYVGGGLRTCRSRRIAR